MKNSVVVVLLMMLMTDCSTVPLSGRQQLSLVPSSEVQSMSYDQYNEVLKNSQVMTGTEESQMIKRVGENIKDATERYLRDNNREELVEDFQWEFNLLKDDDMVNAWAMPGGKLAFYTGIMPVCQSENGVAVVMGHEVAHAIARHGNERMSQGLLQQLGGVALSVAIDEKPEETQQLFMAAYGLGSQVGVLLPYSRLHESEADELGLTFMAMAGYDPREAPELWKRMRDQSSGQQPPEFLSTHPSHDTRIDNLNEWMPDAMEYYEENKNRD